MLSTLRSVIAKLFASFSPKHHDRDLNDEMQEHLALLQERYVRQGMSTEEARLRAKREFGGVAQLQERHRDERTIPVVEYLRRDIRIAARSLLKHRGFSIVAVTTLALGIGATTAIFSVTNAILLKPLPYAQADRILAVWQTAKDDPTPSPGGSTSHLNYLDLKRETRTLESLALYGGSNMILTGLGEAELVRGAIVTPDFFRVFKATPILGREFTNEEDLARGPKVVVISHGFWEERLGGRPDVIGTTIELSSRPTLIVGVAPQGFDFPEKARLWTPVQNDDANCGRGCVYTDGIGRLRDGVTAEQARQELTALAAALEKQFPADNTNVTVASALLQDDTVRNVRLALWLLLGSVGLVLLIACANVANLVLVRGTARQSEMAVRAALGGSRPRLLAYLCAENIVLAMFGAAAGLLLAWWGVTVLKRVAPTDIPRLDEIGFDTTTFLFAFALAAVSTLLFGLIPAIQLSHSPLAGMLQTRGEAGGRRMQRSRYLLVMAEVALSLVLLVGAGLLLRSLQALQSVDLGFNYKNVSIVSLNLPAARYPTAADVVRTFDEFDTRFRAIPGVTSVGYISGLPLGPGENIRSFRRPELPPPAPGQDPFALYRIVDPDYFRTLGIPIVAGRPFDGTDRDGAQRVMIVSRRFAEAYFPQEEAVGKIIQFGKDDSRMIVGIVENVHSQTLEQASQPEMYMPHAQVGQRNTTFVIRSEVPPNQILSALRPIIQERDRNLPLIRPGTLEDTVSRQVARPRFYMLLLALFATLAVSLASIGTFGVVAYAVEQRRKEIGVRIALGARPAQVLLVMLWEGLKPAGVGIALGLAGAFAASRFMSRLLFRIPATDPWTFASVTLLLVGLVALASIVPAARAMRVPAATALRTE